jgi:heterodisulfide reductase subunit A-like polyferredoxin
MSKFAMLLTAIAAALVTNPTDERAIAQKEVADAALEDLDALKKSLSDAEGYNAELEKENDELRSKVGQEKTEVEKASFKYEGDEYEVLAHGAVLVIDGEVSRVTAADIAADEKLQKHLVESNSGLISKKA